MQTHEIFTKQLEKWIQLSSQIVDNVSKKDNEDITKEDIIKIAQKIQDVINVLNGKSKISGWSLK